MGDATRKALVRQKGAIALDTFGGRIHVEWDPAAAVTPRGQVPFFLEFLKVSGVFEAGADCPLASPSNHASAKRAVRATLLLSSLAGPHRYAHITAIRQDGIPPELLGVAPLVSEDAARRALARREESSGVAWLARHLAMTTQPLRTRRGFGIWMRRRRACTASRKARWGATTRRNRDDRRTAITAR